MAKFVTFLEAKSLTDKVWRLNAPLRYESDIAGFIEVPAGFQTDLASVPRVPIAFLLFGGRSHHEAVIHDYLFRVGSQPDVTWNQANEIFLEAMKVRGKSVFVRYPMYWGVCCGSYPLWRQRTVSDVLINT